MTPTTSERDRFEAWAKDTMSLVKEPGGYKEATTHHAWRAWQAALAREQREGVERDAFIRGYKHGACHYIGGDSTEELHEAASWAADHQDEEAGNFGKPQQEAPGAVAGWSEAEQRATLVNSLRASKSWMTGYAEAFVDAFQDHARTTPPAPVDVRALREKIDEITVRWRDAAAGYKEAGITYAYNLLLDAADEVDALKQFAILDDQPAVVDDAMVRRAVNAYDEWMIEHAPDETDAYHAGMRAALQAALGGGGGGGD